MKTSNKILLIACLVLMLTPLVVTLMKKERKNIDRPMMGNRVFSYNQESLKEFKHLKIIGNDSVRTIGIYFSYSDKCSVFHRKDNAPEMYSFDYKNDTLLVQLADDKEYFSQEELGNLAPRIHLFARELESVELEKINLQINEYGKERSIDFLLNQSTVRIKDWSWEAEKVKSAYKSIQVDGYDSNFELINMAVDSLNISLKGKSKLEITLPEESFKSFKAIVSQETTLVNFSEDLRDKVKYFDKE